MRKYRGLFVAAIIIILMIQMLYHINQDELIYNHTSKNYYIENGLYETSSKNLVTAIYLDYRLFDSFLKPVYC